ncbi:MAG TPA: hypothetical protein VEB59_06380 [Gemmatimonadales bacterium]|nr:hypothetical protein [Gemmatimonadales bacterium]
MLPPSLRATLRNALRSADGSADEPLRLLRLTAGILLFFGTIVAVALALSGVAPRALELVAIFWAIYGFLAGMTSGVLEPVIEGIAHALQNWGLMRAGGGYSGIETMVARGRLADAAEAYRERARTPRDRVEATLRRSALLAGPLAQPETALVELENLQASSLPLRDDLRVGLALVDLYDRRLGDPGRAMGELRRLIDRHPEDPGIRRLRGWLAALKSERFETPTPGP